MYVVVSSAPKNKRTLAKVLIKFLLMSCCKANYQGSVVELVIKLII